MGLRASSLRYREMDEAELVGGVLLDASDPRTAGAALAEILSSPALDESRARALGLDNELVRVLRRRLPRDPQRIERACAEGAAWVMGRRSLQPTEAWELVASLPPGTPFPSDLSRTTGETMLSLVSGARRTVRIAAPFIDRTALGFLADALVAATNRLVHIDFFLPGGSSKGSDAAAWLLAHIRDHGDPGRYQTVTFRTDAPWAHLKVLAVDCDSAYIGSANVTSAALGGWNLELGVLVRGPTVRTIEWILDTFRE